MTQVVAAKWLNVLLFAGMGTLVIVVLAAVIYLVWRSMLEEWRFKRQIERLKRAEKFAEAVHEMEKE